MPPPAAAGKTCIVCGQDCSNKPRTKDAQGRYTCKECYEKLLAAQKQKAAARAAASAPVAATTTADDADPGDDGVMASLLQNTEAITETCPSCGSGMGAGSMVCTICGYNKDTGQVMGVKTLKAPKEKRSGPGLGQMLLNPTYTGLAAVAILGGLFAMGFANEAAGAIFIILTVVYTLVFQIALLIDAFRQGIGTGLLYMIVPLYAVYYMLVRCERPMLKTHGLISFVAWGGLVALLVMSGALEQPLTPG